MGDGAIAPAARGSGVRARCVCDEALLRPMRGVQDTHRRALSALLVLQKPRPPSAKRCESGVPRVRSRVRCQMRGMHDSVEAEYQRYASHDGPSGQETLGGVGDSPAIPMTRDEFFDSYGPLPPLPRDRREVSRFLARQPDFLWDDWWDFTIEESTQTAAP